MQTATERKEKGSDFLGKIAIGLKYMCFLTIGSHISRQHVKPVTRVGNSR